MRVGNRKGLTVEVFTLYAADCGHFNKTCDSGTMIFAIISKASP